MPRDDKEWTRFIQALNEQAIDFDSSGASEGAQDAVGNILVDSNNGRGIRAGDPDAPEAVKASPRGRTNRIVLLPLHQSKCAGSRGQRGNRPPPDPGPPDLGIELIADRRVNRRRGNALNVGSDCP